MDANGEWIVGSEVPLGRPWRGPAKLARMLETVIEESLQYDHSLNTETTPVIVCIAERDRLGRKENLRQRLAAELSNTTKFRLVTRFVSQGRVGAVVALREARALIYEHGHPAVIIAAVDSYLTASTLNALEENGRLLTSKNSDGFVPGEGAAAIVVKRPVPGNEPQLLAVGIGFGFEKTTIESEEPLRADGMVEAVRGALLDAGCDMGDLDFRITDVSGEQYAFKEATLALTRLLRTRKEEFDIWHAADCVGETGAAAGPICMNLAWAASQKGYSKGNNILCHFANDDGKRAAAVLTYRQVGRT